MSDVKWWPTDALARIAALEAEVAALMAWRVDVAATIEQRREKRAAYQREYMRKRREAKRNEAAPEGQEGQANRER